MWIQISVNLATSRNYENGSPQVQTDNAILRYSVNTKSILYKIGHTVLFYSDLIK